MSSLETKVVLESCGGCGRQILVSRMVVSDHYEPDTTLAVSLTCWDCLDPDVKARYQERYNLRIKE